uniref:Uncharacterized protein n=1 Tax=Arundo donax TaxID=35708 RepID=A0A0A9BQW3_ARUDO
MNLKHCLYTVALHTLISDCTGSSSVSMNLAMKHTVRLIAPGHNVIYR